MTGLETRPTGNIAHYRRDARLALRAVSRHDDACWWCCPTIVFPRGRAMELKDCAVRREEAARLFNEHEGREDGLRVANSLADGLSTLRNLLFTRIHEDVQQKF